MKNPIPSNSTALVSGIVLLAFAIVAVLTMTRVVPDSPAANSMLATLETLATMVVAYWVGSSAGSAAKTTLLANSLPVAPVTVPIVAPVPGPAAPVIVQTPVVPPAA